MQHEQVGEAPRDDIRRPPVHAPDAEQRDLAEDGALAKGDDNLAAVDTAKNLDLT